MVFSRGDNMDIPTSQVIKATTVAYLTMCVILGVNKSIVKSLKKANPEKSLEEIIERLIWGNK